MTNCNSDVQKTIQDYIVLQEMFKLYAKKRNDLEKEYNRLLANYNDGEKNYTLDQANKIYGIYREMVNCEEQSKIANDNFIEAESELKRIGEILYEASIQAQISLPAINGTAAHTKSVVVTFSNGGVTVR